ncbi:MAG: hypothetical protein JO253_08105 [Alphaproteobacteria bacterium]|nr:hypothetical protein [Alphaproteobacteria bacterium]
MSGLTDFINKNQTLADIAKAGRDSSGKFGDKMTSNKANAASGRANKATVKAATNDNQDSHVEAAKAHDIAAAAHSDVAKDADADEAYSARVKAKAHTAMSDGHTAMAKTYAG